MNRNPITRTSDSKAMLLVCSLVGVLTVLGSPVYGQTLADYTAYPPFVPTEDDSGSYPPNILLVVDTSPKMNVKAYRGSFDPSETYVGMYDGTECYRYNTTANEIFEANPDAGQVKPCDVAYPWDGNLLNYVTMRRIDIVKWALVGSPCSTTRANPTGECVGGYLVGQGEKWNFFGENFDFTQSISDVAANGRIPNALVPAGGEDISFHQMGSDAALKGSFCVDNDQTPPDFAAGSCDDPDPYPESIFKIRAEVPADSTGIVQQLAERARFGLMEFNHPDSTGAVDGGKVLNHVDWKLTGDIGTLMAEIERVVPRTEAQMAESLYEAARYFAQVPPEYDVNDYTSNDQVFDPYYFNAGWLDPPGYVPCCKSFVLLLTAGEPTADTNLPPALRDYYTTNDHYLDDVALWAHTTDLRQDTIPVIDIAGKDLTGFQNVTLYTLLTFGSGSVTLQSAAKAGGFKDRNGNNLPDVQAEWDRLDNVSGAAGGDGVPDTYFEANEPQVLKDRLLAAISTILQETASGSAASVIASSSTGEGAVYQSFFFPSITEGSRTVNWLGHTQGLFLDAFGNLREDDGDAKLVYEDDMILRMRFASNTGEPLVDRFVDADGNGLADSQTPVDTVLPHELTGIWEAGSRLAQTSSSARKIWTWLDTDNDGEVDQKVEFRADAAGTDNSAVLGPYLRPGVAPFTAANIINFIRGDQIAGMRDRQLTLGGTPTVWKLGDSAHATPVVVGAPAQRYGIVYGDPSYTDFFQQYTKRRQVAYVGSNDGMLHAFNAGYVHRGDDPSTMKIEHGYLTRTPTDNSSGPQLGDELFGFIPQELLPHLKWLTQPDYTHVYYVDLTPKVTDVRIFTADPDHPNGWGTILMGGFRMGGSCGACTAATGAPPMTVTADFDNSAATPDTTRTFYSAYFVLDITNPESPDYPKLLWSFSSSDLGLTTSVPSMLRVSPASSTMTDNTDARWYMIVGSGATSYQGGAAQSGNLYAIDLDEGPGANNAQVIALPAETLNSFMGNTLTVDPDFDYRVDATYMGSVIDDGIPPWRGKLYRLTMNDCATAPCSTNAWGVDDGSAKRIPTEILDTFPSSGSLELGPIATAPAVAIDDSNKLWVFAGTGRLFGAADKTNTDKQYFVGVKDSVLNGGCAESTATDCHANDLVDVSTAQVCVVGKGDCGSTTDQVTNVTGATDFPSLISLVASKDGWYTTLPATGERALARPLVFGGLVLFPTFVPDLGVSDACRTTRGESFVYALYYVTGSAYSAPVIGTTAGAGGKEYLNRSTSLGAGLATEVVVHIGDGGALGQVGVFTQNSLGQLFRTSLTTTGAITSRLISWHKRND